VLPLLRPAIFAVISVNKVSQSYEFTLSVIPTATNQLLSNAVKFLRAPLKYTKLPTPQILEAARLCLLKDNEAPFVRDSVAKLIAYCAY
jgi:hypothetical protein